MLPNPEVPLVTGLQLAYTRINADFQDVEIDGTGTYGVKLFTVSPTVAWDATDKLTLWSSIGWDGGKWTSPLTPLPTFGWIPGERFHYRHGDFFSVGAGANMRVWQSDASALSLQVAGVTASFLGADSKQGRVAAQFSHDSPPQQRPSEVRREPGVAAERWRSERHGTERRLNWLPDQGRLSGSTSARVLLLGRIAANGVSAVA